MGDKHKVRRGYRVIGPNVSNYQSSTWTFETLDLAKTFAIGMVNEVDVEYDILKYVGSIRQKPKKLRPIEWVEAEDEK